MSIILLRPEFVKQINTSDDISIQNAFQRNSHCNDYKTIVRMPRFIPVHRKVIFILKLISVTNIITNIIFGNTTVTYACTSRYNYQEAPYMHCRLQNDNRI